MTEDISAQTGETPYFRVNEAAKNQLQHLSGVAQIAQEHILLEVIKQALDAPGVYVFGELLVLPNVQALKDGKHQKYYNTLNLFAYGTYKEYRQQLQNYIELTDIMQKKLQHLTLVSLATKNKRISYELLSKELEVDNVRHLEDVIIEAIYADVIRGKMFQNKRYLEVDYAQGRDIPPDYTSNIVKTLQDWVEACDTISECIDSQIKHANQEKYSHLENKKQIEQKIANLKKTLKTDGGSSLDEGEENVLMDIEDPQSFKFDDPFDIFN